MGPTRVLTRMGSKPIPRLKWVLHPFLFVRPNLYSRSGSKTLEGILPVELASLVEGHWRTCILLLSVVGFNPSNFYALLYGAPTYGDVSISLYSGYRIRAYVRLLIRERS